MVDSREWKKVAAGSGSGSGSLRDRAGRNRAANLYTSNRFVNSALLKANRGAYTSANRVVSILGGRMPLDRTRRVGEGSAYGVIFETRKADASNYRDDLIAAGGKVMTSSAYRGLSPSSTVLLKVIPRTKNDGNWADYVRGVEREAVIQRHIASSSSARVVPDLYWAGVDPTNGLGLIAMQMIRGVTLKRYLQENHATMAVYRAVEKAFAAMWRAGVIHMDMHGNNVMLARDSRDGRLNRAVVIDFGYSVMLPTAVKERLTQLMRSEKDMRLYEMWDAVTSPKLVAMLEARLRVHAKQSAYYPDWEMLRALHAAAVRHDKVRARSVRRGSGSGDRARGSIGGGGGGGGGGGRGLRLAVPVIGPARKRKATATFSVRSMKSDKRAQSQWVPRRHKKGGAWTGGLGGNSSGTGTGTGVGLGTGLRKRVGAAVSAVGRGIDRLRASPVPSSAKPTGGEGEQLLGKTYRGTQPALSGKGSSAARQVRPVVGSVRSGADGVVERIGSVRGVVGSRRGGSGVGVAGSVVGVGGGGSGASRIGAGVVGAGAGVSRIGSLGSDGTAPPRSGEKTTALSGSGSGRARSGSGTSGEAAAIAGELLQKIGANVPRDGEGMRWKIVEVPGDGTCMFHAVAEGLNRLGLRSKKRTLKGFAKFKGEDVREELAKFVDGIVNKTEKKKKLTSVEQEILNAWDFPQNKTTLVLPFKQVLQVENGRAFDSLEDYAEVLVQKSYWGNSFDAYLLSKLYKVTLTIWHKKPDYVPSGNTISENALDVREVFVAPNAPGNQPRKRIDLLYNGSDHYDFLDPDVTLLKNNSTPVAKNYNELGHVARYRARA